MKEIIEKYLTQRNRNIISVIVIVLGLSFIINYCFFEPTYINSYIASNVYLEPANSAFEDENFYKCVIDAYNKTNNKSVAYTTNLSDDELNTITDLTCYNKQIVSISGIEKLTKLTGLNVSNNKLTELDVSNNTLLTGLNVSNNQLTELDVSENKLLERLSAYVNKLTLLELNDVTSLTTIDVGQNQLTELDVSQNIALTTLDIRQNKINDINIENNVNLLELYACYNGLTKLDVSQNVNIKILSLGNCYRGGSTSVNNYEQNQLIELDVSKNSFLTGLYVDDNKLTELDVSQNQNLISLNVIQNQLTELDVSNNVKLEELFVGTRYVNAVLVKNMITELDVSKNVNLRELDASYNQLNKLDVSGATSLKELYIVGNQLTELDVSQNELLEILIANHNQLNKLDVSNATLLERLEVCNNQLTELDMSQNELLKTLRVYNNQLTKIDVSKNSKLVELEADYNQLNKLDVSNATLLEELDIYNNQLMELDVSNNVKLETLRVYNNQLTKIDVSQNELLETLTAYNNQLIELITVGANSLTTIDVGRNQLAELDVSQNKLLTKLDIRQNKIRDIDIENNVNLLELYVCYNGLIKLDVSKNVNIKTLGIGNCYRGNDVGNYEKNSLSELDLGENINLVSLDVSVSQLTKLDVSGLKSLISLNLSNNQLTELDVSQNTALTKLYVSGNPYGKEYYMYKNVIDVLMENAVKIPSHLNWDEPIWQSKNTDIATVDENGLVKLLNVGNVDIVGTTKNTNGSERYTVTNTINVVEITSDKYKIDEDNNYIFVGSDSDVDTIKSNIKKSNEDIDVDIDMDKYKLYVKYEDEILKEFDIIELSSNDYDLSKEYIYVGTSEVDLDKINNINCDKSIEDNKLVIKRGDNVLYEYKLIGIISEEYDLSKGYIYVGTGEVDRSKISAINGEIGFDNNSIIIKYNDEVVEFIRVLSISSDTYDLNKDYIYIGHEKLNLNKIDNINCEEFIEDDMFVIRYNNTVIDSYKLLRFSISDHNMYGDNIVVLEDISYEDFTGKIYLSDNKLTYKIYNGEEEVTSGNITIGMEVRIYYEKLIDTYKITDKNEYVEINDLEVDEENKVINNIKLGSSIDSIISNINTSGNIEVYNKDDELIEDNSKNIGTGCKIKIELTDSLLEYVVSVKGDITGDGISNINDVIRVAKYLTNKDEFVGMEYMNAVDITNDGKVNINDVIRLSKTLMGRN